jgi:hypothetical protein
VLWVRIPSQRLSLSRSTVDQQILLHPVYFPLVLVYIKFRTR